MALSSSSNYTVDRDTLIRSALELCHVAVEGQPLQSEQITVASRTLNMMIKAWVAYGLQVWKRKTYNLTLVEDQQAYVLGTNPTRTCSVSGSGTTATVTLEMHGYAVGESITIAGAVTDTDFNGTFTVATVSDHNTFTYTAGGTVTGTETVTCVSNKGTDIVRPERIISLNRKDTSGNTVLMTNLTRDEYERLPNKSNSGTPVNYHYERALGVGSLYVWPVASATAVTDYTLDVVYQAPMEDVDTSTDNLDFPQEWLEAITYGLAERLAPRYGVTEQERYLLKKEAKAARDLAKDYDWEEGSVYFGKDEY